MKDCNVKAVLIDLDGTLVNTLPDRIAAIQHGLQSLGLPAIDDRNVQNYIGDGVWLLSKRTLQESLINEPNRITDNLIQALANAYEAYYLAHICEQTILSKGALTLLKALKQNNIAIALITNKKNELTYALLKFLGIHEYFDVIMAGQDGEHKPSPDLLLKALQALKIEAKDAVMIGDSLDDREAAKLANIDMMGVAFGYRPLCKNDVQYLMEDLQEALPYLMSKKDDMKKLAPIMFVGTGSDVGKSVITTGFCRIFKQDGYQPAPFKAQNMSNFSVTLDDGTEMAIAQSTQAEAAEIEPTVDMNPIMLKPTADHQSNVLLLGQSLGVKNAYEYFRGEGWLHLRDEAHLAYDRLAERYSPMVLEGAGSISELNLKERDMVNMAMGIYAKANIVLIADIERGGIFASLYGSIMLLPEEERLYIKGIIINKFRGDMKFFESGVKMIEELCKIPVLGVIPYYQDIEIVAEDSLSASQASAQMLANDMDYKNAQYDRLADHIRQYVDMGKIYQILRS